MDETETNASSAPATEGDVDQGGSYATSEGQGEGKDEGSGGQHDEDSRNAYFDGGRIGIDNAILEAQTTRRIASNSYKFRRYRADTPDVGAEECDLAEHGINPVNNKGSPASLTEGDISTANSGDEGSSYTEALRRRIKDLEEELRNEKNEKRVLEKYIEAREDTGARAASRRIGEVREKLTLEVEIRGLLDAYIGKLEENVRLRMVIEDLRHGDGMGAAKEFVGLLE